MRFVIPCLLATLFVSITDARAVDAAPIVKYGAYLDTYYAYDFNNPQGGDRIRLPSGNAYATQPVRQNEFNLNLAYVEAKLEAERVRGRLALQTGNSVQANYAGESSVDANRFGGSGGISRLIQEAYAGYQVAPKLWIDAGVFFSHIGSEGWISKDNWTYTRSLGADNSPYYQTGVRVSYAFSDQLSAQVNFLNGWQNINDTTSQKAVGTQVGYTPNAQLSFTYNTLIGYEADGAGNPGSRIFQDFIAKYAFSDAFQVLSSFDLGMQKSSGVDSYGKWYVGTMMAKLQVASKVALIARLEKFIDPKSLVVGAGALGFDTWGASAGVDVALTPQLLWRCEARAFSAANDVFLTKSGAARRDSFLVTSLALSI